MLLTQIRIHALYFKSMGVHIWECFGENPKECAENFVSAYENRLYKVAYRLCGNVETAEDLVSRTLTKAYFATANYTSESACFAWLCKILHNLYYSDLRRKDASLLVVSDELPDREDPSATPAEAAENASDAQMLRQAIAELSPLLRETIILRYYGGLAINELARVLGADENAVKVRLHTARAKLRKRLRGANLF